MITPSHNTFVYLGVLYLEHMCLPPTAHFSVIPQACHKQLRFEISCFLLSENSHRLLVFCPPCSLVYFSSSHFTSMLKVWSCAPAHRIYYCKILFLVEFVIKLFEFKLTWHCTGLMCEDSKYTTTLEALEKQQNWSEWQHKALSELPSEELELLGTGGFLDLQLSCLW